MFDQVTDDVMARALGVRVCRRTPEDCAVGFEMADGVRVVISDLTMLGDPGETYAMLRSTRQATGHTRNVELERGEGFVAPGPLRGSADCTLWTDGRVRTISVVGADDPARVAVDLAETLLDL